MNRWRYRITVHAPSEILELLPDAVAEVPPRIYCDDEGACYFDGGPNLFTGAIEHLLNLSGEEGWELVQVIFRPQQMIGFWRQPR